MIRSLLVPMHVLLAAALAAVPAGEPLYTTGEGLEAQSGPVTLRAGQAACANCHGGPMDGGGEGGVVAPPLAWSSLSQSTSERPAYDEALFRRALREGIGANGRALHILMPRYRLSDAQADSLVAYLKMPVSLAGVTSDEVVVATVLPAEPRLWAAGQISAQALTEVFAQINAEGGIHGRRLRLRTMDEASGPAKIAADLASDAPLLLIASIGLGRDGPAADQARAQRLINFAPVAALSGGEPRELVVPLLPTLGDLARALARAALAEHGCVRIAAADDPVSRESAAAAQTVAPSSDDCPAVVLLASPDNLPALLAAVRQDGASARPAHYFVAAEQLGAAVASVPMRRTIALPPGKSLAELSSGNARRAAQGLAAALRSAGRNPSRRQLLEALHRTPVDRDVSLVKQ